MNQNVSLSRVDFLTAGWCRQSGRLAGRLERGSVRFHAVFVRVEHPVHGVHLIDVGYGPNYLAKTRWLPERIMRWLLPTTLPESQHPPQALHASGFDPTQVDSILISHFHGDHIGGLSCFANCPLVGRQASYDAASKGNRLQQVARGFVAGLLPSDFRKRFQAIQESQFVEGSGVLEGFRVCDYWNDGSLIWVDLPGHAAGHCGFLLRTATETLFYVVDACWDVESMLAGRRLPWLGRQVQGDAVAYEKTQAQLRDWVSKYQLPLVACHCARTLPRVVNLST